MDYISQTTRRQQQQQWIPPPPSSNRAADVSKGLPTHTHPLINNATFNFPAPPANDKMSQIRTHSNKCVFNRSNDPPLRHHRPRHHPRAPSSFFVSSAITTMRQAAWQRCGTKRRSGGDSGARTRRTEISFKLSPRRVGVVFASICVFSRYKRTKTGHHKQETNARTPHHFEHKPQAWPHSPQ